MKWLFFFAMCLTVKLSYGQYYYNDILTVQQASDKYQALKNNHIRQVTATSYEADGSVSDGFTLTQQLNAAGNEITTITDLPSAGSSTSVATYSDGRIIRSTDSTGNIKKTTTYSYTNGLLSSITAEINDAFMNNALTETHQYFYENGKPLKMLLIKNNNDTTTVHFIPDEAQNIGEEHWVRQNKTIEKYFYYYDTEQRLTDIVRFNLKANRMLPDFLFEYGANSLLEQMTQVPQGSDDYLVWVYEYNNVGLKIKESCFNKQRQAVGHIEYTYK